MFFEECKYDVKEKVFEYITDGIGISSDNSDREHSDEENSNEENSDEEYGMCLVFTFLIHFYIF